MNLRLTLMLLAISATLVGVKLYRSIPSEAAPASVPDDVQPPEMPLTLTSVESNDTTPAEPWGDTLDDPTGDAAWDAYLKAKSDWQQTFYALIIAEQPDFTESATANLRLQQTLLLQKNRQFKYLRDYEPRRIRRHEGLESFTEFDWTEEDNARLASVDKNYVVLEAEIAAARVAEERQKHWPAVVTFIKTQLSQTARFREEVEKHRQQCAAIESQLAAVSHRVETSIEPAVPVQQLLPGTERRIVGLAVKGASGLVYFSDANHGKTGIYDAAPRGGPAVPLWAIRSEKERLEVAGIDGQTLIVVFNEHTPFRSPEEAWRPGMIYYALDLSAPSQGLKPLTIPPDVCDALLEKCLQAN